MKSRDLTANTYQLTGMSCAGCALRVETILRKTNGIAEPEVNFATSQVSWKSPPGETKDSFQRANTALKKEGFSVSPLDQIPESSSNARPILATALTLPLFLLEMGHHLSPWKLPASDWLYGNIWPWMQLILASIVQFGPGWRFYQSGVRALHRLRPDMNSLVMLGTSAAWLYSVIVLFAPQLVGQAASFLYFEAAAVIITLVLWGRYLEGRGRARADQALNELRHRHPTRVRRWQDAGFSEVAWESVQPGDHLQIRSGEIIPHDATVTEGVAEVEESMLTGEPLPVTKHPGDTVTGGTLCHLGTLTCRVDRVGEDSTLSQIARLVQESRQGKLPWQSLVDRVTLVFVPSVLLIAAITFALWLFGSSEDNLRLALVHAVSVLIIACPCALGLATPLSVVAGTGRAARRGILFRRTATLAQFEKITVFAFDKTGTLTYGKPAVSEIWIKPGEDQAEVLASVLALEDKSEHPLALAVVAKLKQGKTLSAPDVTNFKVFPGEGVEGTVAESRWRLGTPEFTNATSDQAPPLEANASALWITRDNQAIGFISLIDEIRPEAEALLKRIHQAGHKSLLLSGDRTEAVDALAATLGLQEARSRLKPADKKEVIRQLQADGERVAFVGDGINDAIALAEADTGIALGSGSNLAAESADVVILGEGLLLVTEAHRLARMTMNNIRQNLFWAFAYNTALLPVAAGALTLFGGPSLSPMLAALAMSLSSLCVVGNALRLGAVSPRGP